MNRSCRLLVAIVIVASCLAPGRARAVEFSIFASGWDTDALAESLGGGLRVGFPIQPQAVVEISAHYFEDFEDEFEDVESIEVSVGTLPVDGGLSWYVGPERTGIYFGAGFSYLFMDINDIEIAGFAPDLLTAEADDEFGWYAKLGYQARMGLLIEVLYRDIDVSIENIGYEGDAPIVNPVPLPESVDVDMGGFQVNLGWRF